MNSIYRLPVVQDTSVFYRFAVIQTQKLSIGFFILKATQINFLPIIKSSIFSPFIIVSIRDITERT
jgi:hypothetical protein